MDDEQIHGSMAMIGIVLMAISLHLLVLCVLAGLFWWAIPALMSSYTWGYWIRLSWLDSRGRLER